MQAIVHAADVQDRDGGLVLMASLLRSLPPTGSRLDTFTAQ